MAIVNDQPYSSDRWAGVQTCNMGKMRATTNNDAGEVISAFKNFTTRRLKGLRAYVHLVGSNANSAITVYKGASSIASIPLNPSTATKGYEVDVSVTESDFTSTDTLKFDCVNATDTFQVGVTAAWQPVYIGA